MKKSKITDHKSVLNFTKYQLRIIEATLSTFSKKGILSTNSGEIAIKAGVRKSTIFYHFKSMENLYDQIFKYLNKQILLEIYTDVESQRGTKNTMEYLWMKRARWGLNNPDAMRFIFTMYALEANKSVEFDSTLLKIIHAGKTSQQLTDYFSTHIVNLFYAGNNSIILSLLGTNFYNKKKITIIKKSFESFYETIRYKKNEEEDDDFYYK